MGVALLKFARDHTCFLGPDLTLGNPLCYYKNGRKVKENGAEHADIRSDPKKARWFDPERG